MIYISGPMSGLENFNYSNFTRVSAELQMKGYNKKDIINPVELEKAMTGDRSYRSLIKNDVLFLLECSEIYMLKGWEKSLGARAEHAVAVAMGMKIHYEGG